MTWTITPRHRSQSETVFDLHRGPRAASREEFFSSLGADPSLRRLLTDTLAGAPFAAFCWETPPLVATTLGRPAEFAVVDSPALARATPDPSAFADAFARSQRSIVTFPNLGHDAILVSPHTKAITTGTHLAEFLRTAPPTLADTLWSAVAVAVADRLDASTRPVWVSTAGLGVSWLHVRLDARPKYYRHREYLPPDA
jgi:hypothetical protein